MSLTYHLEFAQVDGPGKVIDPELTMRDVATASGLLAELRQGKGAHPSKMEGRDDCCD